MHQVGADQSAGATYVFTRPGFVWKDASETAELTAPDGVATDLFGMRTSISANVIAVGGGLHPNGTGKGAVYLFATRPTIAIQSPANDATSTQHPTLPRGRLVLVHGAPWRNHHQLHRPARQRHADGAVAVRSA